MSRVGFMPHADMRSSIRERTDQPAAGPSTSWAPRLSERELESALMVRNVSHQEEVFLTKPDTRRRAIAFIFAKCCYMRHLHAII